MDLAGQFGPPVGVGPTAIAIETDRKAGPGGTAWGETPDLTLNPGRGQERRALRTRRTALRSVPAISAAGGRLVSSV